MPSNAMKISQLIARLQADMAAHGDLDCVLCVTELGAAVAVDGSNVNVAIDLPAGRLPAPALVIGLWQDERGRVKSAPGQAYQATADDGGWTYDRDAAPADTPLIVWRRFGGEDRGHRTQEGRWFVFDGGARAVEMNPAGVLAWRIP